MRKSAYLKTSSLIVSLALILLFSTMNYSQSSSNAFRFRTGPALPVKCAIGDVFYKTGSGAGQYNCNSTNTWTLAAGITAAVTGSGTTNRLALWSGSTTLSAFSAGTSNQVIHGGTPPTFSAVDITADVTGVLPSANGGVPNISTAGKGGFFPGLGNLTAGFTPGAGTIVGSNNQVRARQFVLSSRAVVANITAEITTGGGAGSTVTVAIYDSAGTTKLIDSGTFDGNSVTVQSKAITPTILDPGVYWFGWSASVSTIQVRRIDNNSFFLMRL